MISVCGKPENFLHLGSKDIWNILLWIFHVGEIVVDHLSTACCHAKDT